MIKVVTQNMITISVNNLHVIIGKCKLPVHLVSPSHELFDPHPHDFPLLLLAMACIIVFPTHLCQEGQVLAATHIPTCLAVLSLEAVVTVCSQEDPLLSSSNAKRIWI